MAAASSAAAVPAGKATKSSTSLFTRRPSPLADRPGAESQKAAPPPPSAANAVRGRSSPALLVSRSNSDPASVAQPVAAAAGAAGRSNPRPQNNVMGSQRQPSGVSVAGGDSGASKGLQASSAPASASLHSTAAVASAAAGQSRSSPSMIVNMNFLASNSPEDQKVLDELRTLSRSSSQNPTIVEEQHDEEQDSVL